MTLFRQFALLLAPAWVLAASLLCLLIVIQGISRAESMLAENELELVEERAENLRYHFDAIPQAHADAEKAYAHWFGLLSDAEVERDFSEYFSKQADGTWRSRDVLFEGAVDSPIGPVNGIAAFVGRGALDRSTRREMVAVVRAIATVAPGQRNFLESLWFVTARGDLVIFAPDREDKLDFYRRHAPPETDFTAFPFVEAVMPAQNPKAKTLCTGLSNAVYDKTGKTLITSCQTPKSRLEGAVGVWGTSLSMTDRLGPIVSTEASDRLTVLAASDGTVITGPGFSAQEGVDRAEVSALTAKLQWPTIQRALLGRQETGVVDDSSLPWFATFQRIEGPELFLVQLRDRKAIYSELAADLPVVAAAVILLLIVLIVLCLLVVRLQISSPLQRLTRAYASRKPLEPQVITQMGGTVEIRALQNQLDRAWGEAADLLNELEARVASRTDALSAALEAESNANKAKDRFLANISHEIRTPLNGMTALADTLLNSDIDQQQREIIQMMRAGGESLTRITSDILDAAKLDADRMDLVDGPIELRGLLDEVLTGSRLLCAQKGVALEFHYQRTAQGLVVGDGLRLKQIVHNLVSNAIKFTERGAVRILVEDEVHPDGATWIRVAVEDTGIGFDPAIGEQLFQRFVQADSSTTRRADGTGLGLAISRALAQLMGGTLTAASQPNVGSRFLLRLPLKQQAPEPPDPAQSGDDQVDGSLLPPGLRVLVVEDHDRNRQVMRLLLEELGATAVCAGGGLEGVGIFRSQSFDLVLMDLHMPDVDGLTATQLVRAYENEANRGRTPIVMISASALPEHATEAKAAGCDAFISKPITVKNLCDALALVQKHPGGMA